MTIEQHIDNGTKLLTMSRNYQHKNPLATLLTISTTHCNGSSNTFTELHAC